jgi:uncharacterized protein
VSGAQASREEIRMTQRFVALALCIWLAGCGLFGKSADVAAKDARSASPAVRALVERAQAGEPEAQQALGAAYETGTGVRLDLAEAEKWYRQAAAAGQAEAQYRLASLLLSERRFTDAVPWYERAAAQGHPGANTALGKIYDQGTGVMRDSHTAFTYFSAAADLGSAEAMWNISLMFNEGRLGKKNPFHACIWGLRARRFASADRVLLAQVAPAAASLERPLSGREVSDCRNQAESWEPKRPPK